MSSNFDDTESKSSTKSPQDEKPTTSVTFDESTDRNSRVKTSGSSNKPPSKSLYERLIGKSAITNEVKKQQTVKNALVSWFAKESAEVLPFPCYILFSTFFLTFFSLRNEHFVQFLRIIVPS
jgi:hypothetical protein